MVISPLCDACGEQLSDFGAILLSPPDDTQQVKKLHLCQSCYKTLLPTLKRVK
jgi:hypothetical protein